MIETAIQHEILFFDDFMHQTADKVKWDHVKFNHPVFLEQIRIIPKDCYISLNNGTSRFGRTCPKHFRLEFYANNLNKKEEERATLVKIGSLLYKDDDQHNSNDLSNFIVKPQSVPLDWLVIVGSYSSLSVALIGVKAKQSVAPNLNTVNPLNNINKLNQSSFMSIQTSQPGFQMVNQSQQQRLTINSQTPPQSIPLMNSTSMETNGQFASIRAANPSLMQPPQTNMLNHPPPNHNMPSLLPTPLLTIPPSNMNHLHHQQQTQNQQQNDYHHQPYINQSNNNMRLTSDQLRFQINQPPPTNSATSSIQYPIQLIQQSTTNQTIRPLLQQPPQQQQRNQKLNNIQQQQPQPIQTNSNQQKNFTPRPNQYQYRMPMNQNAPNSQIIPTANLSNRISPTKVVKPPESAPLLSQLPESVTTIDSQNNEKLTQITNTITSPNGSNQSQETQLATEKPLIDDMNSNDNELNMIETNLNCYLDINEETDELELVRNNRDDYEKSKQTLDDFLQDQISQIDFKNYNLNEIKNPILNKYEQLINEKSKFEMNANEKRVHEYLVQNESFKTMFLTSDNFDLTNEKNLIICENLLFNLNKSVNLFYNLFALNTSSLMRLNELVIRLVNVNYCEYNKVDTTCNNKEWLFRIKNVKLGLKLASLLVTKYDTQTAKSLIDLGLQDNLIDLVELSIIKTNSTHLMSLSMTLKCLNLLNLIIQYKLCNLETLNQLKSRLLNLFLKLNDTNTKSRVIFGITQILINFKFHDLMNQLVLKCQNKFIKKLENNQFNEEIISLIENIYIHCVRCLKLNRKQLLNETSSQRSNNNNNSTINQIEQTEDSNKQSKKLKPNDPDDFFDSTTLISNEYFLSDDTDDLNKLPLQNLFDQFPCELTSYPVHNLLLRWFDSFDTLKYILMIKSYIYDKSKTKSNKHLTFLNNLLDKLFNDLYNVSELNGFSCAGIEYLINNSKLTKCIFKIISNNEDLPYVKSLNLSYKTLIICGSLMFNLNEIINRTNEIDLEMLIIDSVDKFQLLAFMLNKTNLVQVFASPDGNMSNKYVYCLLNWFELMIVDKHFNELSPNKDFFNFRCFILNSLTEIFYTLCKLNPYWSMPNFMDDTSSLILVLDNEFYLNDYRLCLKRLSQYVSLLINSLSSVRVKSFQDALNLESIDKLVYKLKTIKSYIEPICITMASLTNEKTFDKLALNIASLSSYYIRIQYLNQFIDLFRRTIDKNLNMFFLKNYFNDSLIESNNQSSKKRITIDHLNSNITILNILNNITEFKSIDINLFDLFTSTQMSFNSKLHTAYLNLAKYSLDSNEQFNAKRYLGHLISRNFMHVCIHLLNKASDYLIFYSKVTQNSTFTTLNLNENQLSLFLRLIELTTKLIRTLISKLIKIRNESYTDCSALPVLFKFNGVFNYCIQSSLNKLKPNRILIDSFEQINKHLIEIFITYTQPILSIDDKSTIKSSLLTNLFRELAKYTIEKPFNFYLGLKLFSQLLPLPLPIPIQNRNENREEDSIMLNERRLLSDHLEVLFFDEKFKRIDLFELNEKNPSVLKNMFCLLSTSSLDSKINHFLKRVIVQMSDLSSKMCSHLLKCLLNYATELFAVIRDEKDLDDDLEETEHKNGDIYSNVDIYEENIAKQEQTLQKNADSTQLDLIKTENDRIDGLINEIVENNQLTSLNGVKLKDSEVDAFLYDTEIMLEDTTFQKLTPLSEASVAKEVNDKSLNESLLPTANVTKEQIQIEDTNEHLNELKEKHKLTLMKNFSNLIRFICSLLELDRPGCEINPIRLEFINLLTDIKFKKSKMNYLKFVCQSIKYCNQFDLSLKLDNQEELIKTKDSIQESLFALIEALIRYTPDLFSKHFKLKMFYYEEFNTNLTLNDSNEQEDQILDLLQKCLLDHLSTTKLKSFKLSNSCLTSLILLSKLFRAYLTSFNSDSIKQDTILINPLLKMYLTDNTYSLISFIRELDNSFKTDSIEFIDLLSKFYIFINLLLENVISDKRFYLSASRRLRDLFEWNSSKFNIKGLQIDTIPISKSLKNKPSNENSLDNLLILIANVERTNDLNLDEKIEFCSNQTKRLVNILNDVTIQSSQNMKLEVKLQLELSTNLGANISKLEFNEYFMKRSVFSSNFNQDDFRKYEIEWIISDFNKIDSDSLNDDLVKIDLNSDVKALFKSDLECNLLLIQDVNLRKQLNQYLDQTYLEDLFLENLETQESKFDPKVDNLIDSDSVKSKNVDMIRFFNESYRRYKAPMRGGHSNPVGRHLVHTNTLNSNLINNMIPTSSSFVNNLNNLPSPSNIILNSANLMSRHDPFRTRAPNTSRPASLHVDEYYRLQNANKQQNHVK